MSGGKKIKRHPIAPDPLYDSVLISKFINQVMRKGKKTIARKIVYQSFEIIKEKTKKDPLEVFDSALKNAAPLLEIKPKRIGGATYQVPVEVKGDRKITLAIRWIIEGAKSKKGKPMKDKLAEELIEAANNSGSAVRKRINTHKMAEANRAFAHFAW
ncbi:MAG: 30S ribosomal protein S7 [Candidatus Pacebacteria bacterium]|nr:30S ribosomal protein S7 [Candidatus Paceibacterota bacterium]